MNTPEGRGVITEAGRTSSNPKQQELAVRIYSRLVKDALKKNKVPITIESIYFGHHFGWPKAGQYGKDIFLGKSTGKLPKDLLTNEIKEQNPNLVKWKVKTNGDMRMYLKRLLKRGAKIRLERTGK